MYQQAPATPYIWDTIKILIGMVTGFTASFLLEISRRRRERANPAAAYLNLTADALEGMAESFKKMEIPTKFGHILESLIPAFHNKLKGFVDDNMREALDRLSTLAASAADLDAYISLSGGWEDGVSAQRALNEWIHEAMQVAGDLRGRAGILPTTK